MEQIILIFITIFIWQWPIVDCFIDSSTISYKKKKVGIHKCIGKLSFIILPLLILSVVLLKHSTTNPETIKGLGACLWFVVKHNVIILVMFTIAMRYSKNMQIHARAMIAIGIEFLEPGWARLIFNIF